MSRWRWNSPRRSVARSCFRIFRATNTARQSSIGLDKREEWVLPALLGAAVWDAYETGRTNLVKGMMNGTLAHGTPRRKRSVRATFGEADQLLDAPKHGRGVPTGSLLQLEMLAVEQQCHCPIERLFVCHNRTFSSELRGTTLGRVPSDADNARLNVSGILLDTLDELKMSYPKSTASRKRQLKAIRAKLESDARKGQGYE